MEVLTRALTRLHQYNSAYYFYIWCRGIANNLWKDMLRQKKSQNCFFVDVDESIKAQSLASASMPSDRIEFSENMNAIKQVIANSNPAHKQILSLRYLEEKSYSEISDITKTKVASISSILSRTKQLLKAKLLR